MNVWIRGIAPALVATATVLWVSGCGGGAGSGKAPSAKGEARGTGSDHKDHKDAGKEGDHKGHKEGNHKDQKEGHAHKALTEKDVKMPDSFTAGVGRLEDLHKKIAHQIEHKELKEVHRTAEEMALVANKTKELAQKSVAEDKLADAGRLCNEIAGYFKPIDEAADAGKKADTEAIHKKMGEAIGKLKHLVQ